MTEDLRKRITDTIARGRVMIGPEHVEGYVDPNWRLSGWWRVGIGYRF